MIRSCVIFAGLLLFAVGAHAQQVAFVGGNLTYQWQQQPSFNNPGWVGYGFQVAYDPGTGHELGPAQTIVNQLIASANKPSIIHLLVGSDDGNVDDGTPAALILTSFESEFGKLVTSIQNAKIKLIVGTEPFQDGINGLNSMVPYNEFIYQYCQAHNIPVVDYYSMIQIDNTSGTLWYYTNPGNPLDGQLVITSQGWSQMTNLAQSAINQAFDGVVLKAGYLGNTALLPEVDGQAAQSVGVNNVPIGTSMQWYAYGEYSNGKTLEINNANINGVFGTWISTNPAVIKIQQNGSAWAIGQGTTSIKFTTLSGATISEWNMTVTPGEPDE